MQEKRIKEEQNQHKKTIQDKDKEITRIKNEINEDVSRDKKILLISREDSFRQELE